jgi:peptidoglycan hydrolase-like protein with peptidoglycan-binding domain
MKKIGISVLLALLFALGVSTASAQTTDVDTLIAELEAQIKNLQSQVEALRAARGAVQQSVTDLQGTLKLLANLREGMTGDQVILLQTLLSAESDIYPEGIISGYYGRLTSNAVRKFQAKYSIEQVGVVGPKTRAKLNALYADVGVTLADTDGDGVNESCVKVPPGHLVAPGWLRKQGGVAPIVPECQTLPPGIQKILNQGGTGTTTPPTTDTTAPVISAIAAGSIATTSAKITWTTDEMATGEVWYGLSLPLASTSSSIVGTSTLSLSHDIDLMGLSATTTYFYIVVSADAAGNTATSSEASFVTTE